MCIKKYCPILSHNGCTLGMKHSPFLLDKRKGTFILFFFLIKNRYLCLLKAISRQLLDIELAGLTGKGVSKKCREVFFFQAVAEFLNFPFPTVQNDLGSLPFQPMFSNTLLSAFC